jgi:hypothetical protein
MLGAQLHAQLSPLIKVILNRNRASNALARPYTPVLLERLGTVDTRLVGAGSL